MSAIRATSTRVPPRVARAAAAGVLVVIAAASLLVLAFAIGTHPVLSGMDAALLAADLLPFIASLVTAGFIVRAPTLTWFSAYLAVTLVLFILGATRIVVWAQELLPGIPGFLRVFTIVSCFGFLPIAYLFPNGRFVPRWSPWLLVGWGAAGVLALSFDWSAFPPAALAVLGTVSAGLVLTLIGAQLYRYLRVSTPSERQQTKWLLLALAALAAWILMIIALPPRTIGNQGPALDAVFAIAGSIVVTGLAAAIGLAMLRYRLYDVDLVLGRALVYGTVTVFVVASYVLVVGAVGLVWPAGTPLALPIAATVAAALGVNPVRTRLQRQVNRRLYGQRDEPETALSQLGEQLSATSDLDGILQRIATTTAGALRLPRVTVLVGSDHRADSGDPALDRDLVTVPIEFEGEGLGSLTVSPRAGERLSVRDRTFVERLAAPAGVAIRNALTTEELRVAHAAVVAARTDERSRLHRDLHDGLGPTLASIQQRLELAQATIGCDPARAREILSGASAGVAGAFSELREVVEALRPTVLDALGLEGALREQWSGADVTFAVSDGLGPLPPAVEVAAYRICMEAVSNSLRHSGAAACEVALVRAPGNLRVEIVDRGTGRAVALAGRRTLPPGGLRTMRERAAEAGGTLSLIDAAPGTRVVADLPVEER